MKNILAVNNLSIQYPYTDKPTLSQLSFAMEQGESLLIVGASGCGKSSLALAIAGLFPEAIEAEQSGTIYLNGTDVRKFAPGQTCQQVGLVFQDPEAQFCMLTVEDEIVFGLENIGLPRDSISIRIEEALEMMGLTKYRNAQIHRLSGGMKQRVALACVLALHPSLLILDEPTANLDPAATDDFFQLLEQLMVTKQHTIILIEHKLEKAATLVDRVMVIDEGRIIADGSARSVFASQNQLLLDIGVWQPYASEIGGKLKEDGVEIVPHPLTVAELLDSQPMNSQKNNALYELVKYKGKGNITFRKNNGLPAVSFDHVSFGYRTPFHEISVLEEIHWQIQPGSFVALLGQNGAGKSTLGRLALGLLKPTKGDISLFGENLKALSRRRLAQAAGLVFQNPEHQFVTDSVWEEIAYSLKLTNIPAPEIPHHVDQLLGEFSLIDKADANPFTLSQGEKRRLSVASMLATDQQLLILDEPSFGQDYTNTYKLMNLVKKRQLAGCTIIMITHDMRLVWEYATEVALLSQKKLGYSGPVQGLFAQKHLLENNSLKQPLALTILEELQSGQRVGAANV